MRHLLVVATIAVMALALPGAVTAAQAQCTTGCSSTSSCNGTGKSGCVAECDGYGRCQCNEDKCGTQLLPVTMQASAGAHFVSEREGNAVSSVSLLVDCHGNTLDVRLIGLEGQAVFTDLPRIELRPARPRPAGQLASRE